MGLNHSPSKIALDRYFSKLIEEETALSLQQFITLTGWQLPEKSCDYAVYHAILSWVIKLIRDECRSYPKEKQFDIAKRMAIKFSVIFGTSEAAALYIKRCAKQIVSSRFVERAGMFLLPETANWSVGVWREIIKKQNPCHPQDKIMQFLPWMDRLEKYARAQSSDSIYKLIDKEYQLNAAVDNIELCGELLKKTKGERRSQGQVNKWKFGPNISLTALKAYAVHVKYDRAEENIEAANLFLRFNRTEKDFNRYLDLIPAKDKLIPEVSFSGRMVEHDCADFYMSRLAPSDPLAAVLGRLTGCCQSIGDDGEDPVIHGITSENGGFYVLIRRLARKKSEVIAQCWAWRSSESYIVFDSIEISPNFRLDIKNQLIIKKMFSRLALELIVYHKIPRVLIGSDRWLIDEFSGIHASCKLEDYSGYRDSYDQVIVADNQIPFLCLSDNLWKLDFSLYEYMQFMPEEVRYQAIYQWCEFFLLNKNDISYYDNYILPYANFLMLDINVIDDFMMDYFVWLDLLKKLDDVSGEVGNKDFLEEKSVLSNLIYENINKGVNKEITYQGRSVFSLILDLGWWDVIHHLMVKHHIMLKREYFDDFQSILHLAVEEGQEVVVESLIISNPSIVNELNFFNETALHVAASHNHFNLVVRLINAGIDCFSKSFGRYAFELTNDANIQGYIMSYMNQVHKIEALFRSISNGDMQCLMLLLSNGLNAEARSCEGETMLHVAVTNKDPGMAIWLMKTYDCLTLGTADNKGVTPWHLLYQQNPLDIFFLLAWLSVEKIKTVINSQDGCGNTMLHVAAKSNCYALVDQLILYGADPGLRNNDGLIPKQLSSEKKIRQAMLLKAGGRTSHHLFHSPSESKVAMKKNTANPLIIRRHTK